MKLSDFDFNKIKEQIAALNTAELKANRLFYKGDHWQNGNGWVGPWPEEGKHYQAHLSALMRAFTFENVIEEVVDRHVAGLLGLSPSWAVVSDDEQLAEEATVFLNNWIKKRSFIYFLKQAVTSALWANAGFLRFRVEADLLDSPLDAIRLEIPDPASVIKVKKNGQEAFALLLQKNNEISIEVSFLNESNKTVLAIVDGSQQKKNSVTSELSGNLLHHEIRRKALIQPDVCTMQRQLNKTHTMMAENTNSAGFVERTIINGRMSSDAKFGAGRVNEIMGVPYDDGMGRKTVTVPSYIIKEPSDPQVFTRSLDVLRASILRKAHQLHAVLSGDAVASGESRRQALGDYKNSLLDSVSEVQQAGQWVLETVLHLWAYLSEEEGKFKNVKVQFELNLNL